ncbi:C1 family peptidase [Flavihumibacter profundi]|uniref:C1 family peptidase n=1 Tax=Flavihumibacter profundi TaxID=2716883 RepID=UPI001CC46780|nr:C1 family peptidase [Flavihumibacter profundi]MBZ5857349.1 peptidase C1A papain [Flavihumibacter profundi]
MPIRMVDDPQDQEQFNDDSGGGRSGGGGFQGGGGGLIGLLPLVLSLFRGKRIFLLIIIVGVLYFILGRGGCNMGGLGDVARLATGGFLDPRQFEKAEIYEPLADDDTKNPLPESANLQKFAPAVGNQGNQGSCVAWSSAYGARSILEAARTGQAPNTVKFSPSFLYNQIGLEDCQGSYIIKAMEYMTKQGSVPYDQFPYTDNDCSRVPDRSLISDAAQFKMRGFNRLSDGDRTDALDIRAIKENLAQGAPVVIGMMVGQSFMQDMMGKDVWVPQQGDRNLMGFGGHAMCVVGYDDRKYGGSFLLMNSWGPEWGNNGFAWVRYGDFKYFVREAYGLDPMRQVGAAANTPLIGEVGLVEMANTGKKMEVKGYISLHLTEGNRFVTNSPLKPGTRFKMEVKNSSECYVYVFGKETDGTSYTLFPYPKQDDPTTTKYSPFCGITGYRLFPKDKSMTPDSIGTKDMIAVVMSKQPLDWFSVNTAISKNPATDYQSRVNAALGENLLKSAQFNATAKGTMSFSGNSSPNQVMACVVEIDKTK